MPKASSKSQKNASTQPQTSIPLAVRDEPAPKSAKSLLAGLASKAKTKEPAAKKQDERPVLPLSDEATAAFREFAPIKELSDIFDARVEALKGELETELRDAWTHLLWKNKTQPVNPAIRVLNDEGKVDSEGMFIVQERFKLQIPDNDNPVESIAALLIELGCDKGEVERLLENELDVTPSTSLRPFNELVAGHYEGKQFIEATAEEKVVGEKLLNFVTSELTEEEQAIVLLNVPKTNVKGGFFERVCSYVRNQDQLKAILKVFVPVVQNKGAKFAVSSTPVEKTARLVEIAQTVLGSEE